MFCKSAGKECAYLEQIERTRQDALLELGITSSPKAEEEAQLLIHAAAEFTEKELHCTPEFCATVGNLIHRCFIEEALKGNFTDNANQ